MAMVEAPEQGAPEGQSVETLFRWSGWIHVGPGAGDCESVNEGDGTCECANPLHWHAWARLPNQLQHEVIREKSLAAKGRRVRQLKDPTTDAYDALEGTLDELAAEGDAIKEGLVVELLEPDRMEEYLEATREVMDLEEPSAEDPEETVKPYEHVAADRERLDELLRKDEKGDEADELTAHLERYAELVERHRDELHKPKVAALMADDIGTLIDKVRRRRIRTEANAAFMIAYSRHEWLMCTLTQPGGARRFASVDDLETIAPEVYEGLRRTFDDLEQAQNQVVTGNS